jgi:hypothetical protein
MHVDLPQPTVNHRIDTDLGEPRFFLDLAWPTLKVAAECDGPSHSNPAQWVNDISRTNTLSAMGWSIVRATPADVSRPTAFLGALGMELAKARQVRGTPERRAQSMTMPGRRGGRSPGAQETGGSILGS